MTRSDPASALRSGAGRTSGRLFDDPGLFLPVPLAGQGCFDAPLLARLEVIGVTLDLLDDVLLLDLALEAAQRALDGLAVLNGYFRQCRITSSLVGVAIRSPGAGHVS